MSGARPLVTGRTRLYHGTSQKNTEAILREGLRPVNELSNAPAVTNVLPSGLREEAQRLVYLEPRPMLAKLYAGQADALAQNPKAFQGPLGGMNQERAGMEGIQRFGLKGVLQADVPLWRNDVAQRLRKNPEARGNLQRFMQETDPAGLMHEAQHKMLYDVYDKAIALEGGLSPEFIRKSPHFKGVNPREILEYARTKPGRFAGGVALGTAGAAATAYGLHGLYKRYLAPQIQAYRDRQAQQATPSNS